MEKKLIIYLLLVVVVIATFVGDFKNFSKSVENFSFSPETVYKIKTDDGLFLKWDSGLKVSASGASSTSSAYKFNLEPEIDGNGAPTGFYWLKKSNKYIILEANKYNLNENTDKYEVDRNQYYPMKVSVINEADNSVKITFHKSVGFSTTKNGPTKWNNYDFYMILNNQTIDWNSNINNGLTLTLIPV